jgi:hypothetical protein
LKRLDGFIVKAEHIVGVSPHAVSQRGSALRLAIIKFGKTHS